jgi:hypothetical protein
VSRIWRDDGGAAAPMMTLDGAHANEVNSRQALETTQCVRRIDE